MERLPKISNKLNIEKIKKKYPVFYRTCLYLKDNIFYQDIFQTHENLGINYDLAEKFCRDAFIISQSNWETYFKKVFNLLETDIDFLKHQVLLEKTGRYKYSTFKEVEENVYKSKNKDQLEGAKYLWGLYFSQIFWGTHYRVFNFYLNGFVKNNKDKGSCLEAPCGAGIFLMHFLANNKNWNGVGVDFSKTAIDITKNILSLNEISKERTGVIKQDINEYKPNIKFNRIICGEFLEHVENPLGVLHKMNSLLTDDGKMFLTTAAWTAGIDHIYLYKNVNEIRKHIIKGGFKIEKEFIQNIFNKDKNSLNQDKKAILYAAILKK